MPRFLSMIRLAVLTFLVVTNCSAPIIGVLGFTTSTNSHVLTRWMTTTRYVSVVPTTKYTTLQLSLSSVHNVDDDKDDDTLLGTDTPQTVSFWPSMDTLDRRLIKIALPCIANYAIGPLIGAVDLFWVNRMGNALAVAGQAAANQIFSSAFWLASFLPSG